MASDFMPARTEARYRRKAARLWLVGFDLPAIARAMPVDIEALELWADLDGWPPRIAETDDRESPVRWRCDCGRLNDGGRCAECGTTAEWA